MNLNSAKFNNIKYLQEINRKKPIEIKRDGKLRFDRNERLSPIPEFFLKKIKNNLNSNHITTYPNLKNLYKLMSKDLKISRENILITAGSDIAIKTCFELLIKKNDKIITIFPTYGMVDVYAQLFQAKQKKIKFKENLNLNENEILNNLNKKIKLLIIANPNSPTGTIIKRDTMIKILKKSKKTNTFVLIDECYFGFCKETYINKIKSFNNLIISRSFSKAFGMAGCRVGLLAGNKLIINKLSKFRPMHEITYFSAYIGEFFLKNKHLISNYIKEVKNGLSYFKNFLKKMR